MYIHELKIGNVKIKNNIWLAPMAGITDLPFRNLCKSLGAGLATTEMVSSKALFYGDEKTKKLMNTESEPKPISIQIFGSDVEAMGFASKYVSDLADIIDINMGCPAPKVTKNGDGSKLLLDLEKAEEIMKAVVENATVPVTLKIRKGWDSQKSVACEIAQIAEKVGISLITVHGRTREEYYSGNCDLESIRQVKECVKTIPVIGNGDIVDEETAKEMFDKTGVDGIMIGRGALGNPWIFEKIIYFLQTGEKLPDRSYKEKLELIEKHINWEVEEMGEVTAVKNFRKHIAAYSKNMPNSSEFRNRVNKIEDKENLINVIRRYFLSEV